MRVRFAVFVVVITALIAGILFRYRAPAAGAGNALSAAEVAASQLLSLKGEPQRVTRGDFEIAIQEEGELRPVKVTSLNFLTPGKIGFMVPEGTNVKKGERVIALETKELEDGYVHMLEDLASVEATLSQQQQTRELELKRLATELNTEKEKARFAALKEKEQAAHPNGVEKEEARNIVAGAETRLHAAETDLTIFTPLYEAGFGSREDYLIKSDALAKARIEQERAAMKARIIRDGALPDDRARSRLERESAELALKIKQIDVDDQTAALNTRVVSYERAVVIYKRVADTRKLDLEHSTLYAPHDGVVVYRPMTHRNNKKPEVGERVSPGGAPADLPNYEKMKVRTQVPESLIRKIHARGALKAGGGVEENGSLARVTVKTLPGFAYSGQIVWIDGWARDRNSRLSEADIRVQGLSGVKVFDVEVELDESDPKRLRDGFRANVDFPEQTLKNVIAIPEEAVRTVDGISMVMVMSGFSGGMPRRIELGMSSQKRVEVKSGLEAGETIYVPKVAEAGAEDGKHDKHEGGNPSNKPKARRDGPPKEHRSDAAPTRTLSTPAPAAPPAPAALPVRTAPAQKNRGKGSAF